MPFTIQAPKPAAPRRQPAPRDDDSDSSDVAMGNTSDKRDNIVTPGEVITDDPQWMRGHGTYTHPPDTTITSSVAGTITRTNRLISVRPLRARYTPEVGDLVVGRITEVQAKLWRVDVGAAQLAKLPLSAINLPGGILRKRTETDELAIRNFFAEGDLLIAEVQQLYQDGGAVLHTRSLRYGKLRNGLFLAVSGGGGGGGAGVVRSRRQVWSFETPKGPKIEVVLGVNGYVFIGAQVPGVDGEAAAGGLASGPSGPASGAAAGTGVTNMEDSVSAAMYSSQNDPVDADTMREIARLRSVIVALVEHGIRVDEDTVMKGYNEMAESGRMSTQQDGDGEDEYVYLGGQKGEQLAQFLRSQA